MLEQLIMTAVELALSFIPGANLIKGIAMGIIGGLPIKTPTQGTEILKIIQTHLTIFSLAIQSGSTPDAFGAARATFEIGLTKALRDAGYLETVG